MYNIYNIYYTILYNNIYVYICRISQYHENFVVRKKMRFSFVVHPRGKWRKNRRKTGACLGDGCENLVARADFHEGVSRRDTWFLAFQPIELSERPAFNLFFLSPSPLRGYFLQPPLLRGCLSKETRRQLRSPVTEKSAFSEADSKQSSSIAFCVFDVSLLLLLLVLFVFFFFFRLRKIKILFSSRDLICHFDEFTFDERRKDLNFVGRWNISGLCWKFTIKIYNEVSLPVFCILFCIFIVIVRNLSCIQKLVLYDEKETKFIIDRSRHALCIKKLHILFGINTEVLIRSFLNVVLFWFVR